MEERLLKLFSDPLVGKLTTVLVGMIVIASLMRLVRANLGRYIESQDNRYRTKKLINVFGYVLAGVFVVTVYNDRLGGITVVLGLASAGLAFALQEVIMSIAGWVAIQAGGIYNAGDRVRLGGVQGDVIDLGMLRTTIMEVGQWVNGDLYNGRIVRVPNSFVFKEPVYNYSTDFPFLWDEIKLPIKYGSDYRLARHLIQQVGEEVTGEYAQEARVHWEQMLRKFLIEDATTTPMVSLIANDNWVEFTLRYTVDYKLRRSTKDLLFARILEEIDQTEGKVQFASATFDVVELPTLDVSLKQ